MYIDMFAIRPAGERAAPADFDWFDYVSRETAAKR
jgi:hypothetical protein